MDKYEWRQEGDWLECPISLIDTGAAEKAEAMGMPDIEHEAYPCMIHLLSVTVFFASITKPENDPVTCVYTTDDGGYRVYVKYSDFKKIHEPYRVK